MLTASELRWKVYNTCRLSVKNRPSSLSSTSLKFLRALQLPMAQSQRRGRVKAPNIPIASPHNSESASNAHDIARVFNTMEDILAASNDIIQRDEVYPICQRQNPSQFKTVFNLARNFLLFKFAHCYIGQIICPHSIAMGKYSVASWF
jgi:hypothetical protein